MEHHNGQELFFMVGWRPRGLGVGSGGRVTREPATETGKWIPRTRKKCGEECRAGIERKRRKSDVLDFFLRTIVSGKRNPPSCFAFVAPVKNVRNVGTRSPHP
jgi:hypothetical protein